MKPILLDLENPFLLSVSLDFSVFRGQNFQKIEKICFFVEYQRISTGSRGETDTPGPGESVSAIRFIGKHKILRKRWEYLNFRNLFFWPRPFFLPRPGFLV